MVSGLTALRMTTKTPSALNPLLTYVAYINLDLNGGPRGLRGELASRTKLSAMPCLLRL